MNALRRPTPLTPAALVRLATDHATLHSEDPDRKVGCLLLDAGGWLVGLGANRVKASVRAVLKDFPYLLHHPVKQVLMQHAEVSALEDLIHQARDRAPSDLPGLTAAVTYFPCERCAESLIVAGVTHLVSPMPDFTHHRWGESWRAALMALEAKDVTITYAVAADAQVLLPSRRPSMVAVRKALDDIVDSAMADAAADESLDPDVLIQAGFDDYEALTGIGVIWEPDDGSASSKGIMHISETKH